MKIVNKENFEETINNGVVLVDFFANWCGPCKMLSPMLEELSETRSDINVVKVDIDADPDLAYKYQVMQVPTMLLFNNGELVAKTQGFQPVATLENFIDTNVKK